MTDKSNKPKRTDRERAAKMRSAYTNPYKTVSAAQRRIQDEVQAERAGEEAWRERRRAERQANAEGQLTSEMIAEALHNPTKTVTEAELREQYNHVIADVRSMAILAGALVIVLITLAFVLPR